MKAAITILLSISCFTIGFSQQTLRGKILNTKGEAIFAANIFLKNNLSVGSISDFEGGFTLDIPQAMTSDTLTISYVGYLTGYIPLASVDFQRPLVVRIKEDQQSLIEVIVKAKRPISEEFAVTKLDRLKIYTTPIAQGDPLKAITALPASTNTDESANPALRGSSASRSLVIFNRVPVQSPVRNSQINGTGFFSLFNPEMIKEQFVYASNPPLIYGNSSAGLVEIETNKEVSYNQFQFSVGLASMGLLTSQKVSEKAFVQAYGNFQFSEAFIGLNRPTLPTLRSFGNKDAGVNFNFQPDAKTSINLFSYGIDESYEAFVGVLNYEGPATGGRLRNFNVLNINRQLKKGNLSLNFGYDHNNSTYDFGALDINSKNRDFYASLHYKHHLTDKYTIELGSSFNNRKYISNDSIPQNFQSLRTDVPSIAANIDQTLKNWEVFAYQTLNTSEKTIFTAGLRANLLAQNQPNYLSYQLGFRQYLGNFHSILLSGGQYHNFASPTYFIPNFQLLKSRQLALDYEYKRESFKITAAAFYKQETGDQSDQQFISNRDEIRGLEFFFEKTLSKEWSFSIANTFLDHKINIEDFEYTGGRDLNYFLKAILSYQNRQGYSASLIYVTRPGLPYTPIIGGALDNQGAYFPLYDNQINQERFNPYNNLSFAISRYKATNNKAFTFYLNINNILNTRNQSSFFFDEAYENRFEQWYQLRTVYFGAVWQFKAGS